MIDIQTPHEDLLVGTNTLDDAGVFRLTPELALVQTVDYFTPIVDDPYTFGQIAAANALSDVYAMGATPKTVLNIVGFPISKLAHEVLAQILQGGADKVKEAGAVILGGHSIDDTDPKFGMSVTGLCHPEKVWTNTGAQPGDALVLTKPLGIGVITTGIKRGLATDEDIAEASHVMATLNKLAAEVGHRFIVHACTDITGFGFLGHTLEMAKGSGVRVHVQAHQVPILARAAWFVEQGSVPGGTMRNIDHVAPHVTYADEVSQTTRILLADSITSGGLLLAMPAADAAAYVKALHDAGSTYAAVVAHVSDGPAGIVVES